MLAEEKYENTRKRLIARGGKRETPKRNNIFIGFRKKCGPLDGLL